MPDPGSPWERENPADGLGYYQYEGILVSFEGGPKHGHRQWWNGGPYIDVAEHPLLNPFVSVGAEPVEATFKRVTYRIDDKPQPGGAYIARLVEQ